MRAVYLALALWGAVHPMGYFLQWLGQNGFDLLGLIDAWHANAATSGLVWDLTILAVTLSVWIAAECLATRRWRDLLVIPVIFGIGVSCGFPLYLFLRAGAARQAERN
jgi:hypothetical protein